jgi:hypothetical protein
MVRGIWWIFDRARPWVEGGEGEVCRNRTFVDRDGLGCEWALREFVHLRGFIVPLIATPVP